MLVFRPVTEQDLAAVHALAAQSPVGVTSLQGSRARLAERIRQSESALSGDIRFRGEERYLFVLEDSTSGELAGVAGIDASAGYGEPFYCFRNDTLSHSSASLGLANRVHVLTLCHDLSDASLLTAFYAGPGAGRAGTELLSLARLMFVACHPQRFADTVVSTMLGVTEADDVSPFWDSVGRVYFGIDYAEAERICGEHGRRALASQMPQQPIYVPLLSESAQLVMGEVGEEARVGYDILYGDGFEVEDYIDAFDGGPVLLGRVSALRSTAASRTWPVASGAPEAPEAGTEWLLANTGTATFRAVRARASLEAGMLRVAPAVMLALQLGEGAWIRALPCGEGR